MEDLDMNNFVKMDVAIELLADKISKSTMKFYESGNSFFQDEVNVLMEERKKMYDGDDFTINKIINVYGEELKNE